MKKAVFIAFFWLAYYPVSQAQNVGIDIASPQQKLDVAGAIKIGSTTTGVAGSVRWNGTQFQFHDGTQWITLAANTDDQLLDVIQLNGNNLEISVEDDGVGTHSIDLSQFLDNTDDQQITGFTLSGSDLLLTIEDAGGTQTVSLSSFMDNTDDQQITDFSLSGTSITLQIEDAGSIQTIDLDPLRRLLVDDDGDTKVEVEKNADEDIIRFTTAGSEAMIVDELGNVGVGVLTGVQNQLVVQGSASDSRAVLGLRGGNAVSTFSGGPQIAFGYDGDDSFQHFIHTRHNSAGGSTNNAIDFYVSDGTQYNTVTSGSTHVMTLNSGNVGIGTTSPDETLDVIGTGQFSDHVYIGESSATNNDLYISDRLIDWDNTGYYVDPSSTSRVNEVNFDDGSVTDPSVYFEDTNTGFYAPGAGQVAVSINGSEAVRVNASSNVGIGVAGPSEKLHVVGNARITDLSGSGTRMVVTDANGVLSTQPIYVGDITGVTAGAGLTGGGTTGAVTLTSNANNGLNVDATADAVQLGGALVENTTITNGSFELAVNLNSSGDFVVEDNGNYVFRVLDNGSTYIGNGSGGGQDIYIADRLVDWDNSGYYIDPGGVNRVNEIMADDGSASDVAYHFDGDSNTGLYQPADNQVGVSINGTEAVRINASRNLGVGTTAPARKLDVNGTVRIRGGSPTAGDVLMSADGNGNANWTASGYGLVPIGTIVAWHGNLAGVPGLPTGWLECNGQTISDAASPMNGQSTPNLNGGTTSKSGDASRGRFLRGNTTSGQFQNDESNNFQQYHQDDDDGGPNNVTETIDDDGNWTQFMSDYNSDDRMRFRAAGVETRVTNMSVRWIMRIK